MNYFKNKSPFYYLTLLYVIVSFFLRIILLFHPLTQSKFSIMESIEIFAIGFISDVLVFCVGSAFLWLYLLFLSNSKFNKPWGYIIFSLLLSLFLYIILFNTILNEYGGSLPEIVQLFVGIKLVLFGLLLFLPKYRKNIRLALYSFTVFLFVLIIIQNAVSEFFFWNEFALKYNFIAVDYLVYTNTVIGNIMESYPVIPLFTAIGVVTIGFTFIIVKRTIPFLDNLPSFVEKLKNISMYVVLFLVCLFAIPKLSKLENSQNVFKNELQANGIYKFYTAFMNSVLDYDKFYITMPINEAFAILNKQIEGIEANSTLHKIESTQPEIQKNVVLITIESFSADFMSAYGNNKNITPFLDSLATKSLQFTNLYAVGNRTVRGLEAVTLCLPPTPGESVVKREDNKNKFSTGSLFLQKGYNVKYMYGGDAYFDNMNSFFGGNNYAIVDKKTFKPEEISFSNIWGVCDEDMFKKAIGEMNNEAKENKPFFNHIMTVSNHRPFTYPENKIEIKEAKSREGGVKYTDYAIKKFFEMAKKQDWYKNTVFVIVADHCASSSGKTELPMDKYRIPAMVFSEGFIEPQKFNTLMSQIDVMPTLMGLLKFNYTSKFYGQDVFSSNYKPRALIATYQDLGLIKDNVLTIISPNRKVKQFDLQLIENPKLSPEFQLMYNENPIQKPRPDLIKETVAYYQTTSYLLKNKKLNK